MEGWKAEGERHRTGQGATWGKARWIDWWGWGVLVDRCGWGLWGVCAPTTGRCSLTGGSGHSMEGGLWNSEVVLVLS